MVVKTEIFWVYLSSLISGVTKRRRQYIYLCVDISNSRLGIVCLFLPSLTRTIHFKKFSGALKLFPFYLFLCPMRILQLKYKHSFFNVMFLSSFTICIFMYCRIRFISVQKPSKGIRIAFLNPISLHLYDLHFGLPVHALILNPNSKGCQLPF